MRRWTNAAVLTGVAVLTLTACDRPYTRDDARSVPHSAIQVGEYGDQDWEYVDVDGAPRKLERCSDTSVWNTAYRCLSSDGAVELSFNLGKRGMTSVVLNTGDGDVPLDCINDGSGSRLRLCMPVDADG